MSAADFEDFLQEVFETTGKLERDQVYEMIKDPKHPMHDEVEWDSETCVREWVLHQIDRKIRMVKMKSTDLRTGEVRQVRYWVANRQAGGLTGYRPTEQVMADPMQAQILLSEIMRNRAELTRKVRNLVAIARDPIRQTLIDEFGEFLDGDLL
jgi:hypothetical protein